MGGSGQDKSQSHMVFSHLFQGHAFQRDVTFKAFLRLSGLNCWVPTRAIPEKRICHVQPIFSCSLMKLQLRGLRTRELGAFTSGGWQFETLD